MKRVSHALSFALVFGLAAAAACAPPTNTTTTGGGGTNTAAPAPAATPAATPAPAAADAQLPVTLPVLDAMFQDPSFADELKARLALTDEQVARLRRVAEEERAVLSEEGEGGSTQAAAKRATEKINEVVGADKLPQFASLVRARWSGGEPGGPNAPPAKPNSVPTDTRIVVNAPAFRMDVFENGKLLKTYRVGIGYPEFPLPQGLRKANLIIFNPTWTPPDEPWVKGKIRPGEKVEAGSKLNPLGPVKIPIGLPSLIHGGKSPARLGSFASHGCVGLTDKQVQDFAVVLAGLGGAQVTAEDVTGFAKNKTETKNVRLERDVPVELRYETIVVEDGKLYIFRDVYEKGTNTEENLRAALAAHGVRLEDLSEPERAQALEALKAMARDPQGNPVDAPATPTPSPTPGKKGGTPEQVRETRTVKGQKQVVIEIAALRGKGYPAPANLDTGGAPQPKSSPAPKKRGARA